MRRYSSHHRHHLVRARCWCIVMIHDTTHWAPDKWTVSGRWMASSRSAAPRRQPLRIIGYRSVVPSPFTPSSLLRTPLFPSLLCPPSIWFSYVTDTTEKHCLIWKKSEQSGFLALYVCDVIVSSASLLNCWSWNAKEIILNRKIRLVVVRVENISFLLQRNWCVFATYLNAVLLFALVMYFPSFQSFFLFFVFTAVPRLKYWFWFTFFVLFLVCTAFVANIDSLRYSDAVCLDIVVRVVLILFSSFSFTLPSAFVTPNSLCFCLSLCLCLRLSVRLSLSLQYGTFFFFLKHFFLSI